MTDTISERNEIHGQLVALERIKTSLEGELTTLNQMVVEKNKLVDQLNADKESLTKENAEMEVCVCIYVLPVVYSHSCQTLS